MQKFSWAKISTFTVISLPVPLKFKMLLCFNFSEDAQRKISTISTSADSGYNEKTTDDALESQRLNSPNNKTPQRKQAAAGPPPVNI